LHKRRKKKKIKIAHARTNTIPVYEILEL